MGNLRQSTTDEEWDDLGSKIKQDKANGKPDSNLIHLYFGNLSLKEKISIRKFLSSFYDDFALREMDAWIEWDKKQK